jgi:tetratricopeptide (TPR) repeat protein
LELFVRIFLPQEIQPVSHESKFGILSMRKANFSGKLSTGFPSYYFQATVNNNHLRKLNEVKYEKGPNVFRILLLGDSRVFGNLVNDDETISYYLEKLLNKKIKKPRFEILNVGNGNWGLGEIYTYFRNEGYKFSPDLVVLFSPKDKYRSINPVTSKNIKFTNIRVKDRSSNSIILDLHDLNFELNYKPTVLFTKSIIGYFPFWDKLNSYSHTLTLIRKKLSSLFSANKIDSNGIKKKSQLYFRSMGIKPEDQITYTINDALKVHNSQIPKIDVLEKAFYYAFLNKMSKISQEKNSKLLIIDIPGVDEVFGLERSKVNMDMAQFKNIPYFKPTLKAFSRLNLMTPLFFPMDIHFTPVGNQLMAISIFNYFMQAKLFPMNQYKDSSEDIFYTPVISELQKANLRLNDFFSTIPYRILYSKTTDEKYKKIYLYSIKRHIISYLKNNVNNHVAHYQLGGIYFSENEYAKAVKHFSFFLDGGQKKLHSKALYHIGMSYLKMKNYDSALEFLQKAEAAEKNNSSEIFHALSLVHHHMGHIPLAESYLKKAIDKKPNFPGYYNRLGSLYFDNGQYSQALETFGKSLILDPNDAKVHLLTGLIHLRLNNLEKAVEMFNAVLRLQPGNKMAADILKKLKGSNSLGKTTF